MSEDRHSFGSWKTNVNVATTANINLTAANLVIDGVTVTKETRVLVKNQTDATKNGIYEGKSNGKLYFDHHCGNDDAFQFGGTIRVVGGTVNRNTEWFIEPISEENYRTAIKTFVPSPFGGSGSGAGLTNWHEVGTSLVPNTTDIQALGDDTHRIHELFMASLIHVKNVPTISVDAPVALTIAYSNASGNVGGVVVKKKSTGAIISVDPGSFTLVDGGTQSMDIIATSFAVGTDSIFGAGNGGDVIHDTLFSVSSDGDATIKRNMTVNGNTTLIGGGVGSDTLVVNGTARVTGQFIAERFVMTGSGAGSSLPGSLYVDVVGNKVYLCSIQADGVYKVEMGKE